MLGSHRGGKLMSVVEWWASVRNILKLRLMYLGVVVFAAGYLVLLYSVVLGEIRGVTGLAAVLMATGLLVIAVLGVLLTRVWAQMRGLL